MRAIDALADAMSMDLAVEDESLYVRTALKTLSARGFAVVPVEPTEAMMDFESVGGNGMSWTLSDDGFRAVWKHAIAVAQEDGRMAKIKKRDFGLSRKP